MGLLILIWILGLCFVIAEVFFPSAGVLSVLAALSFVSAIFLAYTQKDPIVGHVFLTMAAVTIPAAVVLALRVLPRTPMGRWLLLAGPSREAVAGSGQDPDLTHLAGKRGEAISDLRPAGIAKLDGERVDVVTRGELIERGVRVVVVEILGNRVVVAPDREH